MSFLFSLLGRAVSLRFLMRVFLLPLMAFSPGASGQHKISLRDHTMAKDVNKQTHEPIDPTNEFLITDEKAFFWINIGPISGTHSVRWRWFSPDNSLFSEEKRSIGAEGVTSSWLAIWASIDIRGNLPSKTPGQWSVNVYLDRELLVIKKFTIGIQSSPIQGGELVAWCEGCDSMDFLSGFLRLTRYEYRSTDTGVLVRFKVPGFPFKEAYFEDLLYLEGKLDWLVFDNQYGYLNVIGAEVVYHDEFGGSLEITTYFSGPLQNLMADNGERLLVFNLRISWYNLDAKEWVTFAEYVVTPQKGAAGNWEVERRFRNGYLESSAAKFRAVESEGVVSIIVPFEELPPNYIETTDGVKHHIRSVMFFPWIEAILGNFLGYETVEARDGAVCYVGEFEDEKTSHPQQTVEIGRFASLDKEDRKLLDRIFSFQLYFEDLTGEDYVEGLTLDQIAELIEAINQEGEGQSAQIVVTSLGVDSHAKKKKSPIQKLIDTIEKDEKKLSKVKGYYETIGKLKAVKEVYEGFTTKYTGDPTEVGKALAKALKGAVELFPTPDPTTTVIKEILKAYVEAMEDLVKAVIKIKFLILKKNIESFQAYRGDKKPSDKIMGLRAFLYIKKINPGSWPGGRALLGYLEKVAKLKDKGKSFYDMPKEVPKSVINFFEKKPIRTGLKNFTYIEKIVSGKGKKKKVGFKVHEGRDPIKINKKYPLNIKWGPIDWMRADKVDETHLKKWIWEFFDPSVDFIYGGPFLKKK